MNPITIAAIDKILILVYLAGILFIGLWSSKRQRGDDVNFLLAGRRLSLPAFTATLVSTWYGGILGIGEFTHRYGLLNWVTQALPYYLFAVIFALLIAPKIRKTELFTIPDQLYNHYGQTAGFIGSIYIFLLVSPASHLLMLSILFRAIFGIPFWISVFAAVCFSTLYVFFGGFKSVVRTDLFQFFLMFSGFIMLVFILYHQFGGIDFLRDALPDTHLRLDGGQSPQYIVVWFFIALWTFVDPGFYQRCYAVKTPRTARNGILLAILFWIVFDFFTTTAGLYARAIYPDISGLMAFPALGEKVLPPIACGLFFIALMATIMSTLDSNSFLAAVTFGRDIAWRNCRRINVTTATQLGLALTLIFSILLLTFVPSVIKIWYLMGSLIIPSLLIPLLAVFFHRIRISRDATVAAMVIAFCLSFFWLFAGILRSSLFAPLFPLNIQPFFSGLSGALAVYGFHWLKNIWRRRHSDLIRNNHESY